jgi:hypothetical protein
MPEILPSTSWPPPYQVRLSQRAKRILVSIHATRGLEIVTPKRLGRTDALEIVNLHRTWIEDKLQRQQHRAAQSDSWPEQRIPEQIHFPALGEHWQLSHTPNHTTRTQLHIDHTQRLLTLEGDATQTWNVLQRWFIQHAKLTVLPTLHTLAAAHSDPLQGSGVRWNHTRWGSCSRAGRINLSARLLWLEPAEVNYLLHHELNHLHHFDHSPAFWHALEARLPGAKVLDRGIRHIHQRASFPAWLKLV